MLQKTAQGVPKRGKRHANKETNDVCQKKTDMLKLATRTARPWSRSGYRLHKRRHSPANSGSQQLEEEKRSLPIDHRRDAQTVVGLRDKLVDMNGHLNEFWQRWSVGRVAIEETVNCRKTELPDLMENVWQDFPQYSEPLPRRDAGTLSARFQ